MWKLIILLILSMKEKTAKCLSFEQDMIVYGRTINIIFMTTRQLQPLMPSAPLQISKVSKRKIISPEEVILFLCSFYKKKRQNKNQFKIRSKNFCLIKKIIVIFIDAMHPLRKYITYLISNI